MAELVLGIGASHSPMVTLDGDDWLVWGERDHQHPMLYSREGERRTYEQQLAAVGTTMASLATAETCRRGADRVAEAMARLQRAIVEAELDTLIIVGDDQDEHLLADNLPPFLVYWGQTITNQSIGDPSKMPPIVQRFQPGYKEPDEAVAYPVDAELARHLIAVAYDTDFDVATSEHLPDAERGMGHAFGFPVRRLSPGGLSIVPVMINTYNPPSQPRAARCRSFGAMIRRAIDTFPGERRVGIMASGGLSHFLVLEDLDREVLDAFTRKDLDHVCAIPEATFVAGTSEIKNWIAVASACDDRRFDLVDYVPGYRTPAGSGTGLAFALWQT